MPEAPVPDRDALRDALAYLLDEVAMLRVPLARLPEVFQTGAPAPGALSLRETYALIAARDEARAAALRTGQPPPQDVPLPDGAAEAPTPRLLDRLTEARGDLLHAVDAVPADRWAGVAHALHAGVLEDAALLRTLAEGLFNARGLGMAGA